VYYTAEGYKAVARYDPAIDKIDWMQGTGEGHTHLLVISKDLKRIFTANTSSNSVSAIVPWDDPTAYNAPPLKVVRIPVGDSPEGLGISPDGKEVWAPNKRDATVSIVDVQTLKVLETVDLKTEVPLRLVFTPNGKRVLITDEFDGKVLVIDAVTRKVIKRIQVVEKTQEFTIERANTAVQNGIAIVPTSMLHEILVSPDSSHAYVPLMGSGDIAIIDMNKLEVTGHIPTFPGAVLAGLGWVERR
jgi:YVTN family beta-propeller protein